jgi:hypothetical protein
MIGYALLLYVGVQINAPWWYYLLISVGVLIKIASAIVEAAE